MLYSTYAHLGVFLGGAFYRGVEAGALFRGWYVQSVDYCGENCTPSMSKIVAIFITPKNYGSGKEVDDGIDWKEVGKLNMYFLIYWNL